MKELRSLVTVSALALVLAAVSPAFAGEQKAEDVKAMNATEHKNSTEKGHDDHEGHKDGDHHDHKEGESKNHDDHKNGETSDKRN